METLDEFELKPLTKGLGFHKKPMQQHKAKKPELAEDVLPKSVPKSPARSIFDDTTIEQPLAYEDLLKSLQAGEKERKFNSLNEELRNLDLDDDRPSSSLEISEPLPRKQIPFVRT
ncbi:MAG: hypothetical protein R2827_09270 [Bdellovibrionales bacterium]